MKKQIFFLIFALFFTAHGYSQANRWYFGVNAGIDFSGVTPVALNDGVLNTNEGCSSVSDSAGNLFFYTDGITVWDSTHQAMPNGSGLLAGTSSTQAALIVKDPVSIESYYIFTTDEIGGPNGCKYSKVDMTLNGGLGDVTIKNIALQDTVTEKLAAVSFSGTTWISIHRWGTDEYLSYRLDQSGLSTSPVISHSGIIHNTSQIQNTYGQLKFNTCGTWAASAVGYQDTVDLLHFNTSTGVFSHFMSIPFTDHVYGVEFSPNGSMLYVSTYSAPTLYQFDLSSLNPSTIIASQTGLSITPDIYGLQLAPDGKIYVTKSFSQFLGVINFPDLAGPSCNYVNNGIDLDPLFLGHTSALTLPGFDQSFFKRQESCLSTTIAEQHQSELEIYPNPFKERFKVYSPGGNFIIYDLSGRIVFEMELPEGIQTIQPMITSGFYLLKIHTRDQILSNRIIKESN